MEQLDYKKAGVDIHAGYEAVNRIKSHVSSTLNSNVISDIGGFGALFSISMAKNMQEPVLTAGTDGVGTKLKLAIDADKHDTIGIDCVAMCVNDILCQGAKPLFFLDYIATAKLLPPQVEQIVSGIAAGCRQADTALIGGETAEMPGFYANKDYDLAGFCVGIVDKANIIDGKNIKAGDSLIGIASSGVHSNGFSLVRKIIETADLDLNSDFENGKTLQEALLEPTKIYYNVLKDYLGTDIIKGMSHITGGGFYENIPRMLPKGLLANINLNSYKLPSIFQLLKQAGNLDLDSMYNTFNMGIGMVLATDPSNVDKLLYEIGEKGCKCYLIGEVQAGDGGVKLCQ